MAACRDASSLPDLSDVENEELVLALISRGSFRCRPCSNCQNSDPFQLELTQKDPGQQRQSGPRSCLVCKKCQKPYNTDEDDDDDDDDDDGRVGPLDGPNVNDDNATKSSSFSVTECRFCQNKEKDLFCATEKTVQCLVCGFRDNISPDDKNSDFSEWIECPKCPNRTLDRFVVTLRDDGSGRIHKVTCMSCGHGNTLHDPGHRHRRRRDDTGSIQPSQQLVSRGGGGGIWNALATACSAVASSALKSIQSPGAQGAQRNPDRQLSGRPLHADQDFRQVGVRLLGKLGEEMVVHLGNRFLRNVVSSAVTRSVAVNFGQFIGNLAAVKLQETRKAKKNDQ